MTFRFQIYDLRVELVGQSLISSLRSQEADLYSLKTFHHARLPNPGQRHLTRRVVCASFPITTERRSAQANMPAKSFAPTLNKTKDLFLIPKTDFRLGGMHIHIHLF